MYFGSERELERETERRMERLDEIAHDRSVQEKFILEEPMEFLDFVWLCYHSAIVDYLAENSTLFEDWILENYEEEL